MKKINFYLISIALSISGLLFSVDNSYAQTSYGTDRAGTQGFQFTKITVDARSAAMGNSSIADAADGSSLYWNPALSANIGNSFATISHTQYVVDTSVDYFAFINKIGKFAVGGAVQYFNSGDIIETTETNPFGTGRTFSTQHYGVSITGAHAITDLFSYGLTIRYLVDKVEEISYQTGAIDFGFAYKVGDTGLRFAVGINNFGIDASPSGETTRITPNGPITEGATSDISLPTRFTIGAAYNLIDKESSKLILTGQITNPSDNAEQFSMGTEYGFMNQFFVRAGYEFGNEERVLPSFGAGVKVPFSGRRVSADYGYTSFDRLGAIHRITLGIDL